MLMNVIVYFVKNDMVSVMFTSLGYPTFIIYPLAILKTLGLVAIWSNKSKFLKEWAYAGYTYVFILATAGHANAGDGGAVAPLVALVVLLTSYAFYKKGLKNNS